MDKVEKKLKKALMLITQCHKSLNWYPHRIMLYKIEDQIIETIKTLFLKKETK